MSNDYPQYTKAVQASHYNPMNQYIQATIAAILGGGAVAFLLSAGAASPWCWVLIGEVTVAAWLLAFCDWWLNDRLIALPADRTATDGPAVDKTAFGMVLSIDPRSSTFPDIYDTDFCFNLLLRDNKPGVLLDTSYNAQTNAPQPPDGYLMVGQKAISKLQLDWNKNGHTASYFLPQVYDGSSEAYKNEGLTVASSCLHVEIEGRGIVDLQHSAQILLSLALGGLAACSVLSFLGPEGAAIAALFAIFAALALFFGLISAPGDQASQPNLPNAPGGTLNVPDNQGLNASVVMVTGTWVYETQHGGWNELHPVKAIQLCGSWQGSWGATFPAGVADTYIQLQQVATAPETQQNQQPPQQQWQIHPLIDGCGEYPPILPPTNQQTQ